MLAQDPSSDNPFFSAHAFHKKSCLFHMFHSTSHLKLTHRHLDEDRIGEQKFQVGTAVPSLRKSRTLTSLLHQIRVLTALYVKLVLRLFAVFPFL